MHASARATASLRRARLGDGLSFDAFRLAASGARGRGDDRADDGGAGPHAETSPGLLDALHAQVYGAPADLNGQAHWRRRTEALRDTHAVAAEMILGHDPAASLTRLAALRNSPRILARSELAIDRTIRWAFDAFAQRQPTTSEVMAYYQLVLHQGFGCADIRFRIWAVFQKQHWRTAPRRTLAHKIAAIAVKRYAPALARAVRPSRVERAILEERLANWTLSAMLLETIATQSVRAARAQASTAAASDNADG